MKTELKMLKALIKADLSKSDMKILAFLMSKNGKTIEISTAEMAKKIGIQQSNFVRSLTKLYNNQVVGKRKNGIFVKSINSWGVINKTPEEKVEM